MVQIKMIHWRRRVLKICAGLFVFLVAAGLAAWFFPQQVLTVDSGPVKADVLVVLGGFPDRAVRAAELFKRGEAPKIIVSGYGDCISNEKVLKREGVTNADIILEPKSHTTRENAEFSIPLLRALGAKRVIIVTSWYHSRRALACFEHYAPDIKFYSRPSYYGYVGRNGNAENLKSEMLKSEDEKTTPHPTLSPVEAERMKAEQKAEWKQVRHYANSEYCKLFGYWVCYGVFPV